MLQFECGPVLAFVMFVLIDVKEAVNGILDIEQIVRNRFHVDGPLHTTQPCWFADSIVENHRDNWKHRADEYAKQVLQLEVEKHALQVELQRHKEAIEQLKIIVTCSICKQMLYVFQVIRIPSYWHALLAADVLSVCHRCCMCLK